jgi:zinc transport system substrate-binding protein
LQLKRTVVIPALIGLLVAGCQPKPVADNGSLSVAASFYPLAFMAQQIGGVLVHVIQITPGGVEPHDYDPTPKQLVSVYDANVFLMNGEGVDTWGDRILDDLKRKGVITVRITDSISPIGGFSENGEADPTAPSNANSGVLDPHIWLDPKLAEKEVTLIRNAFMKADPAHADQYGTNADALLSKLSALDRDYRSGLAHCAVHDAVVSHNAFRYLAKEYGFRTLALAGLDPEQESTPKRIAELADLARNEHIHYIFFETLVSPKVAGTVANEIGAQSLVLNPIEGLTQEDTSQGKDYLRFLQDNLQNLRTALQCQ